jgi:NAD(P)-dependent dehydrogenase (short-subunit alcohol dehydrogenase family)
MNAKAVLITGALTGIGRATALAFAKEGARLVVSGRRDEAGAKLVTELRALGTEAEYVHADASSEKDVINLVDQTVKRFARIDVAVNNAGTEGQPGPLIDQTVESYTTTFDTNVLGTFLGLKHELKVRPTTQTSACTRSLAEPRYNERAASLLRSLRGAWRSTVCLTTSRHRSADSNTQGLGANSGLSGSKRFLNREPSSNDSSNQ